MRVVLGPASAEDAEEELEEALGVEVLDERAVRLPPGRAERVDRAVAAGQLALGLDVDETSRVARTSDGSTIAAATIESGCVVPGTPIDRSNSSAFRVTWR